MCQIHRQIEKYHPCPMHHHYFTGNCIIFYFWWFSRCRWNLIFQKQYTQLPWNCSYVLASVICLNLVLWYKYLEVQNAAKRWNRHSNCHTFCKAFFKAEALSDKNKMLCTALCLKIFAIYISCLLANIHSKRKKDFYSYMKARYLFVDEWANILQSHRFH